MATTVKKTPKNAAQKTDRPVIYPELQVTEYSVNSAHGPLTPDDARRILGWETEEDYQARMLTEEPDSKASHWAYGDDFHCYDLLANKVRCARNAHNRPFDEGWSERLMQMILEFQWAGPLTVPGETVNGETIRISRYGRVLSGQHQLTALILAEQNLRKVREDAVVSKYPHWDGHDFPVIETLVVTGLSEDERILRTIDYVKPRTVADMLYTMDLFTKMKPADRKELTRMLASAIDLLWKRTNAKGYKTHPEVVGFLERHKRLLKCVQHLFVENLKDDEDGGRRISKLRLSSGQCAALYYLMASSGPKTDGDEYRNQFPPTEKKLDWSLQEKAYEFWTLLANGDDFELVRNALGRLYTEDGLGGRTSEKFAILASAWRIFKDHTGNGPIFHNADLKEGGCLCLTYTNLDEKDVLLPNGELRLEDKADFEGIDCPPKGKDDVEAYLPPPPTPEEIEALKEEEQKKREEKREKLLKARSERKAKKAKEQVTEEGVEESDEDNEVE